MTVKRRPSVKMRRALQQARVVEDQLNRLDDMMTTTIELSPEIEQRLAHLAMETGRSKSFYLRKLIESGLNDLEDYYLAGQVIERVRQGKEKLHSLDDVERELGLDK